MPLTEDQIAAIPDEATRNAVREQQQKLSQVETGTGPYASGHRPTPTGTAAEPGEKPAETQIERRGTTSPGGTFRLQNIEIPLGTPAGVASADDVKQRMQDQADDIRAMLGDADDAEAKVIKDKLDSGNYDENDLALITAHLNEDHVKKNREEISAKSEERRAEREQKQEERRASMEQKQQERQAAREQRQAERQAARQAPPAPEGQAPAARRRGAQPTP
jgi:hypothetical protein